jgi:hypothetical protein
MADRLKALGIPSAAPGVSDIILDPLTGNIVGSSAYKLTDRLRIVVLDINPFLFSYTLNVKGARVAEATPAKFLTLALGIAMPVDTVAKANWMDVVTLTPLPSVNKFLASLVSSTGPKCDNSVTGDALTEASQAHNDAMLNWATLELLRGNVTPRAQSIEVLLNEAHSKYSASARTVLDAGQRAKEVKAAAVAIEDLLASTDATLSSGLLALLPDIREFQKGASRFAAHAAPLPAKFPKCSSFPVILQRSREGLVDSARFGELRTAFEKAAVDVRSAIGTLRPTATDQTRYYLVWPLQVRTSAHELEILLERQLNPAIAASGPFLSGAAIPPPGEQNSRESDGDDSQSNTVAVSRNPVGRLYAQVGGQRRFTISAGLALSTLSNNTFDLSTRVLPAAGGLPEDSIRVIVNRQSADFRLTPMLMLNTRLGSTEDGMSVNGFHLSLGAGPKTDAGLDLQFFLGVGGALHNQTLFVTAGVLSGNNEELRQGFGLGQSVPPGFASAPTRKRLTLGFGLALSYRVVPW